MNMTQQHNSSERLLNEDRVLKQSICDMNEWIREVGELGMPRFGELGSRLAIFREIAASHFAEEELARYSVDATLTTAQKVMGLNEQHQKILERLDLLISDLKAGEPRFRSWQAAVEQAESLMTEICRHEQHETSLLKSAQDTDQVTDTAST